MDGDIHGLWGHRSRRPQKKEAGGHGPEAAGCKPDLLYACVRDNSNANRHHKEPLRLPLHPLQTILADVHMKLPKNIGPVVLALYLILVGLAGLFSISLGHLSLIMPILALVAGICLLLGR